MKPSDHRPAAILLRLADRHAKEALHELGGEDEAGTCLHKLRRALVRAYADHFRKVIETTPW
jgi:hypothetical protein